MSCLILPDEIITEILSMLPVKSILRFRCVCKAWCKLLSSNDTDFVKKHLNHNIENNYSSLMCSNDYSTLYSIDYCDSLLSSSSLFNDVAAGREIDSYPFKSRDYRVWILGSCNGLLCFTNLYDYDGSVITIWNPCTNEYKVTPSAPRIKNPGDDFFNILFGFGYDCKIKDYKLVRIVSFSSADVSEVSVFTLGSSNSWRRIQNIPYDLSCGQGYGALLNGTIHWIATPLIESEVSKVILCFDVGDEQFQEMQLPIRVDADISTSVHVLGGSICLFFEDVFKHRIDVWVMKDYGVIESWTKHFTIPEELGMSFVKPIQSFKNGEILLKSTTSDYLSTCYLTSYDLKHERARTLKKIRGIPPCFDTVTTYVGSLVPLNPGTCVERSKKSAGVGL